jgi:monodechloroaminopyrrolnitrin synthase
MLGEKTDLPPRDTLIHYTVWNPDGERLRTYTGTDDEKHLIESVKIAMSPLVQAIKDLKELYFISPESEDFSLLCERVKDNLEKMVKAIVHAKRNVSTYYFATELRLYFDPITLNGREYLGPGAVEMPLFVFDHILWGSDCFEEEYIKFKQTYLPYILPEMRIIFNEFSGSKSLLTQMSSMLEHAPTFDHNVFQSIKKIKELCLLLKSFRMPHKKMAEESYNHDGENTRKQGSGGYQTDILAYIMKLNFNKFDNFEKSVHGYLFYSFDN